MCVCPATRWELCPTNGVYCPLNTWQEKITYDYKNNKKNVSITDATEYEQHYTACAVYKGSRSIGFGKGGGIYPCEIYQCNINKIGEDPLICHMVRLEDKTFGDNRRKASDNQFTAITE